MKITRKRIQETAATHVYVYADDLTQKAWEGQAEECAYEPNSFAVPTRIWNCSTPEAQFRDCYLDCYHGSQIDAALECITAYLNLHPRYKVVILPKIGRGCSRMNVLAPLCYAYLIKKLKQLDPFYKG